LTTDYSLTKSYTPGKKAAASRVVRSAGLVKLRTHPDWRHGAIYVTIFTTFKKKHGGVGNT
jgi:hypothetical protein